MRKILRQPEVIADEWRYLDESAADDAVALADDNVLHSSLIIPLPELRENAAKWEGRQGRLGVSLKPADKVEDLAPFLPRLELIAIDFPGPGEGRGYTQARLLRERYKFTGELRAIGAAVKQDLLFFMARAGVDAFELAPSEDSETALRALNKFSVAYQPGAPHVAIQRQRFFA